MKKFIGPFLMGIVLSVAFFSYALAAHDVSPQAVVEECQGKTVSVALNLTFDPGSVPIDALQFDFTFPNTLLTFTGIDVLGSLTAAWPFMDAVENTPGTLTIGGYCDDAVTASGILLYVNFTVAANGTGALSLGLFSDDLTGATTTDGQFTSPPAVTNTITVGDISGANSQYVTVDITLERNLNIIDAFVFDLAFDTGELEFQGVEKCDLTTDWQDLAGSENTAGVVTIGGYTGGSNPHPLAVCSQGCLARVKFHVICRMGDVTDLTLSALGDDVTGYASVDGSFACLCGSQDDDNDGWGELCDNCPDVSNEDQNDSDADQVGDACDNCPAVANPGQEDADNDGYGDACDNCPDDPNKIEPGICGCGVADTDTDNDGTADCIDGCPLDPNKIEPGICGCGVADTDTDNDGTADCIDGCPLDPNKIEPGVCGCGVPDTDTDNDGTADCIDECDEDPNKIEPGICGCGVADTDTDNDGTVDCNDNCDFVANPGQEDQDGDNVGDACDNCPVDMNPEQNDGDGDGNGDVCDACPDDPNKIEPGICGCGVADTDTDNDGTADCNDGCPGDPAKVEPGICGCGVADTDSDNDGTADCNDGCPGDPAKVEPGMCGCGVADTDSDNDGTADCVDNCPDVANPGQEDGDEDGVGVVCDNCPAYFNSDQTDTDNDGVGDACDNCIEDPNPGQEDQDNDGIGDVCDCLLGDVNKDGEITPADALCAYWRYLSGVFQEECANNCSEEAADANCDGEITPGDALCIVFHYLKGTWYDRHEGDNCGCGLAKLVASQPFAPMRLRVESVEAKAGQRVSMPIVIDKPTAFGSFGFQISYDKDLLSFVAVAKSASTQDWMFLEGALVEEGTVRVGGLHTESLTAFGSVVLAEVVFEVKGKTDAMARLSFAGEVDDIAGSHIADAVIKIQVAPTTYALQQNYPNPFNPVTRIEYQMPQAGHVSLSVYNLLGQKVAQLVDEVQEAGQFSIRWDGRDDQGQEVASGVYMYRIEAGGFVQARQMLLVK